MFVHYNEQHLRKESSVLSVLSRIHAMNVVRTSSFTVSNISAVELFSESDQNELLSP